MNYNPASDIPKDGITISIMPEKINYIPGDRIRIITRIEEGIRSSENGIPITIIEQDSMAQETLSEMMMIPGEEYMFAYVIPSIPITNCIAINAISPEEIGLFGSIRLPIS